jgi:hypothetical protein
MGRMMLIPREALVEKHGSEKIMTKPENWN